MPIRIIRATKSARTALQTRLYHDDSTRLAKRILAQTKRVAGKVLSEQEERLCADYALDVFGSPLYAHWLKVYTLISGEFKEGWIPDNYYGAVVLPRLNGAYGRLASMRTLNGVLFDDDAFPDLAFQINGVFFDRSGGLLSAEDVRSLVATSGERVVYKLDESRQGTGVHILRPDASDIERVKRLGNGSFQPYVEQHESLGRFNPSAVATLRISSVHDGKGNFSARAGFIRFGRSGESSIVSASHVRVAVDMTDGSFHPVGHTPDWMELTAHPDTGVAFAGANIPSFESCVTTVERLHAKIPFVHYVGWDLTVDRSGGVHVLEWNGGHPDIRYCEATAGPSFKGLGWESLLRPD